MAALRPTSEPYVTLARQVGALVDGEPDWLPNLANAAAAIMEVLHDVSWAGFYLARGGELVLGPFVGRPACVRVPFGKGVCGTAFAEARALVVPDVSRFPGHIACDPRSRSEVVVPVTRAGTRLGVLDLDSTRLSRFTDDDARGLAAVVDALLAGCDLRGAVFDRAAT